MKGIHAGTVKAETVGLTKLKPEGCKKCHNPESPSYKKFKYAEFWAKIKHKIPKK